MWRKRAHSMGDRASASSEEAAEKGGTHTWHTCAAAGGMNGSGNAAKKAKSVAATS